jgi:hypothetical protein
MVDRLTLAHVLEDANIERSAAERIATEIYDAITANVSTKSDLQAVKVDLHGVKAELKADITQLRTGLTARLDLIEHRLMTRLGGLIAVATGILIAIKYFG